MDTNQSFEKNLYCFIMSVEFHTPPIKANDLMVVNNNNKASFVMSWQEHENRQKFELSVSVVASSLFEISENRSLMSLHYV